MDKFSKNKDYEKAAIYRDRISALRDIQRSQSIAGFNDNRDAIYIIFFIKQDKSWCNFRK